MSDSLYAHHSGALPVVHTLTRVEQPSPTQRHPLAGVWRSTGMLHTCIMAVRYDFSTRAATIVATRVSLHLLGTWPHLEMHVKCSHQGSI